MKVKRKNVPATTEEGQRGGFTIGTGKEDNGEKKEEKTEGDKKLEGTGLFGSSVNKNPGSGLFGASFGQTTGSTLFGGATTNTTTTGSSLFGSSLFGQATDNKSPFG